MDFKEKKELMKKADQVFEKTLDIVYENHGEDNLIKKLWKLSNLGEEFNYINYKLEDFENKSIDDLTNNDKKAMKEYSEDRLKLKLEYYKLFLEIIEKYNK